jgi:nucleotide-binding universal stress UspA family protein
MDTTAGCSAQPRGPIGPDSTRYLGGTLDSGEEVDMTGTSVARRIVVGVDGSPGSLTALRWASQQARLTGAQLEAVAVWEVQSGYGIGPGVADGEDLDIAAKEMLAAAVARSAASTRGVDVEARTLRGHPAAVLIDAAKDADLLVVGSHGRGSFLRALLGSVSHSCVQHATCPVVVVREGAHSSTE